MEQWNGEENPATILLVDDELPLLKVSKLSLLSQGFTSVATLNDSREVMPFLATHNVAVMMLDLFMPHLGGLELLPRIIRDYPEIQVIVMTALDESETAVRCIKSGAFDYLTKPVENDRLITSLRKALEHRCMHREINQLRDRFFNDRLENEAAFSEFVSCNEKMQAVFRYLEVIAPSRQPVLIKGETGTGKELVARAVHKLSGCQGEYVAVNVAGLDDVMFADTLFGHRKGAFTGAEQHREGLVARASGGTLFLDEIGDLSEQSQTKLLRLLQEREYYPVGSDTPRKSDARVVLATNHDLQQMIAAGRFRRDLYYRLCTHQVSIIPLRERPDDIPLLLDHFLADAARQLRKKKPTAPRELSVLLSTYPFPGNVRELESMVHDAVARHSGGVLSMESFSAAIGSLRGQGVGMSLSVTEGEPLHDIFGHFPNLREVEEYLIAGAMKRAKGNQGIAASLLGITRQTLNKRLQSLTPHS